MLGKQEMNSKLKDVLIPSKQRGLPKGKVRKGRRNKLQMELKAD